jgi:hypothetical protein
MPYLLEAPEVHSDGPGVSASIEHFAKVVLILLNLDIIIIQLQATVLLSTTPGTVAVIILVVDIIITVFNPIIGMLHEFITHGDVNC